MTVQINVTAIAADGTKYFGGAPRGVVIGASRHLTDVIAITGLAPKQLLLVSRGKVPKATSP